MLQQPSGTASKTHTSYDAAALVMVLTQHYAYVFGDLTIERRGKARSSSRGSRNSSLSRSAARPALSRAASAERNASLAGSAQAPRKLRNVLTSVHAARGDQRCGAADSCGSGMDGGARGRRPPSPHAATTWSAAGLLVRAGVFLRM